MATSTKSRRKPSAAQVEARKEKAAALHATLETQVQALASSEQWANYLTFAQSFHRYSFRNSLLILAQRPTATQVAGYAQWQEKGRQVIAGAQSIAIYGFAQKRVTEEDKETGEKTERKQTYFPIRRVFDISETVPITEDMIEDIRKGTERRRGNPKAKVWTGDHEPVRLPEGEDEHDVVRRTAEHIESLGWTFHQEQITDGSDGYTMQDGSKRVAIREDMSGAAKAKTALHELAHLLLHSDPATGERCSDGPDSRAVRELEAEATAYVVAGVLGLDTSDYSVGYLTGWSGGDHEAVAATAERVLKTADTILDAVFPDTADNNDDEQEQE